MTRHTRQGMTDAEPAEDVFGKQLKEGLDRIIEENDKKERA